MDISPNSLNQPVSFFTKNTGNNINMAIEGGENHLYGANVFSPELNEQLNAKNHTKPIKKRRKSKRLNTIDTDYLPDEALDEPVHIQEDENNFFITSENNKIQKNIKKAFEYFLENTPLINYFFLKARKQKIQMTVQTLNDINQNVDELLNTAVPYGEESKIYTDIAKNLTDAASILGKAKKGL